MNDFERQIVGIKDEGLHSAKIETLQVNLGLRCNQQCAHCHLEASPQRDEIMGWPVMELILAIFFSKSFIFIPPDEVYCVFLRYLLKESIIEQTYCSGNLLQPLFT